MTDRAYAPEETWSERDRDNIQNEGMSVVQCICIPVERPRLKHMGANRTQ